MEIQDTSDPKKVLEEFEVEDLNDLKKPFNHGEYKLALRILGRHLNLDPVKVHNDLIHEIWKRANEESEGVEK